MKRMRQTLKGWRLHRQTFATLEHLADQYNATLRGWWNYYGSFYKTEMRSLIDYLNQRLAGWARRKYKKLKMSQTTEFLMAETSSWEPAILVFPLAITKIK